MKLKIIGGEYSVCKVQSLDRVRFQDEFVFVEKTDEELSLVCRTRSIPGDVCAAEHGWVLLRIEGTLEFSLTGILAEISGLLAERGISVFAISTYNTDYFLIKKVDLVDALSALAENGHEVL